VNIRGSRTLDAPRAAVFAAVLDPGTLLAVIPGCREIERTGEGEYRGRIALRLPGMVGTYRTIVRVVDAQAPDHGRLEGEVEGVLGTITGQASFRLSDAAVGPHAATRVDYEGQAAIGGPLARLDSRFVEGLAGSLIDQGLDDLNARLQAASGQGAAGQATKVVPA
jgi:carbon monoxide dehydrogenase subunit G